MQRKLTTRKLNERNNLPVNISQSVVFRKFLCDLEGQRALCTIPSKYKYDWNEPQNELYGQLVVPLIFARTIVRSTIFIQSDAALDLWLFLNSPHTSGSAE